MHYSVPYLSIDYATESSKDNVLWNVLQSFQQVASSVQIDGECVQVAVVDANQLRTNLHGHAHFIVSVHFD